MDCLILFAKGTSRATILYLTLSVSKITQAGSGEEYSSLTEKRGRNRMERRLTGGRGGGERRKDKTPTRNGGVEDAEKL